MTLATSNTVKRPSRIKNWLRRAVGLRPRRYCVYTCLFGKYEDLSSQPAARDSDIPFICFTDDASLRSTSWDLKIVEPLLPHDPKRSSRHPKICAHEYLTDFDVSLYIDNSVRLLCDPVAIFTSLFHTQSFNMACLHHSFRATVKDEFEAVRQLHYDSDQVLEQQLFDYAKSNYDLSDRPIWGGFLVRNHHSSDVVRCMKIWFSHVLRYSRRDQLSFNFAARQAKLQFTLHQPLDIHKTCFHEWPIISGRRERTT